MKNTFKWGNKYLTELETSHLINIISWIRRNNISKIEKLTDNYQHLVIRKLKETFQDRINCIQGEINFRKGKNVNRVELNNIATQSEQFLDEFEANEKKYRKGNWITHEEFLQQSNNRSVEKFKDNYGFDPNCYADDNYTEEEENLLEGDNSIW